MRRATREHTDARALTANKILARQHGLQAKPQRQQDLENPRQRALQHQQELALVAQQQQALIKLQGRFLQIQPRLQHAQLQQVRERTPSPVPTSVTTTNRLLIRTPERPRPRRSPTPESTPEVVDPPIFSLIAPPRLVESAGKGKRRRKHTTRSTMPLPLAYWDYHRGGVYNTRKAKIWYR